MERERSQVIILRRADKMKRGGGMNNHNSLIKGGNGRACFWLPPKILSEIGCLLLRKLGGSNSYSQKAMKRS